MKPFLLKKYDIYVPSVVSYVTGIMYWWNFNNILKHFLRNNQALPSGKSHRAIASRPGYLDQGLLSSIPYCSMHWPRLHTDKTTCRRNRMYLNHFLSVHEGLSVTPSTEVCRDYVATTMGPSPDPDIPSTHLYHIFFFNQSVTSERGGKLVRYRGQDCLSCSLLSMLCLWCP